MQSRNLQLMTSNLSSKRNTGISSAVRNTSCSRGWMRILVESLFGLVTVASFILIVLMAIRPNQVPEMPSRCILQACTVLCNEAPYFGEHEDSIAFALSVVEGNCPRIFLILNSPYFENATLPARWLSSVRTSVHELVISGGNLRHIDSDAFMSSFAGNIHVLSFINITITTWRSDMLVGLWRLEHLLVKNTRIREIMRNGLEPVDDTLSTLWITNSGRWRPDNLTGATSFQKLSTVTFSFNYFSNILKRDSFSKLYTCKILYLNNARISAIQEHTFDNLHQIQVIYLNGNNLVATPDGLFDSILKIVNPRVRVHLQNNRWYCDCSLYDLREMSREGMLVVDPKCANPDEMRGKFISNLDQYCEHKKPTLKQRKMSSSVSRLSYNVWNHIYTNGSCRTVEPDTNISLRIISPISSLGCISTGNAEKFNKLSSSEYVYESQKTTKNDIISPVFAIKRDDFSMVEISANSKGIDDFGMLWYQSKCPHEVYCMNMLPNFLRLYNVEGDSTYTFCPLEVSSGDVWTDKCITYSLLESRLSDVYSWMLVTILSLSLLLFGAMSVCMLVRRYPVLLKGSKRIMFVKHKKVDALILPPKVPLRPNLLADETLPSFNDKNIFIVSDIGKNERIDNFLRSKSMRSAKSMAPSYISALEPTEDQLAEWRLRNLDNISTETALSLDLSTDSRNTDHYIYSIGLNRENIYDTLKEKICYEIFDTI